MKILLSTIREAFIRLRNGAKKALGQENAAIDVAALMIGIVVLGIITSLVATTVFVVIPWSQDQAAKNQLKSIMAAEQAYAGMAATEAVSGQQIGSLYAVTRINSTVPPDPSTLAKNYGTLTDLIEGNMFDPAFAPDDSADKTYGEQMLSKDKSICVVKLDGGAGYEAAIRSASGNVFVTNDGWIGPYKVPETSPVCLGRVLGEYVDSEGTVIIPPKVTPIEELDPNSPAYTEEEVAGVDTVVTNPFLVPDAEPVTPEQAPQPPAANKDPKTKEFMFCHNGAMHSNNFNGMVNGHHGHVEDIMPPIPFKNYVGWNWNTETAKIYYNNCQPV